jgi:hypothetical protein
MFGRSRFVWKNQGRSSAPETFKVVIAARLFAEYVDNETPKIEERPFSGAMPFTVLRGTLQLFVKEFFDFVTDGLELRGAVTRADHEIIREGCVAVQIQHGDTSGFLALRGLDSKAHAFGKRFQFQRYNPCFKMYSSTRAETSP